MNSNEFSSLDQVAVGLVDPQHWMVILDGRLVLATLVLSALATLAYILRWTTGKEAPGRLGQGLLGLATLTALGQLVDRYVYMVRIDPHYWPLSNLFESVMFVVFAILALHLVIDRIYKAPGFGLASSGLVTLIISLASLLPPRLRDASPLVPSLQSYWIKIHVTLMLISYAAFALSFVAAVLYLFFHYRARWFQPRSVGAMAAAGTPGDTPLMELLDELTYRLIMLGFPILAIGIITGGLWANHAWGTYWSWDPKETWALITWLVYAAYLHARMSRDWQGAKAAWFAVAGFVSVLITYLGVNYLATGLHTYGKLF
ncbi:MAG: c-type cytochrome biogenesis protein CcsB [Candidatus Sericytochromatia bacterium]|nr:c-type cytochrome biogenesis protein CcsB [Candidatus Sericytochromatia bacterium]